MELFKVYSLLDMEPVKAHGAYLWDRNGVEYLDFYGGHAVISIGHTHPHYVEMISSQLSKIGFYSNAVINTLQEELAHKLLLHTADQSTLRDELLHTVACKSAIKAGMHTDPAELQALVDKVQSGAVRYCPHGRPVAVEMTRYQIEKMFKRA